MEAQEVSGLARAMLGAHEHVGRMYSSVTASAGLGTGDWRVRCLMGDNSYYNDAQNWSFGSAGEGPGSLGNADTDSRTSTNFNKLDEACKKRACNGQLVMAECSKDLLIGKGEKGFEASPLSKGSPRDGPAVVCRRLLFLLQLRRNNTACGS